MSSRSVPFLVARCPLAVCVLAVCALGACGGSGGSQGDGDGDSSVSSPDADGTGGGQVDGDAAGSGGGVIGGDTTGSTPDPGAIGGGDEDDVASGDVAGDDTGAGPSGAFGDPCAGNADCLSGWCVEGVSGYVCTKTCDLTCPDGFDCKAVSTGQDVVFLCMPRLKKLCTPCSAPIHCPGGACLTLDGEGRCGFSCEADTECPVGYGCLEDSAGESEGTYCQPLTGSCLCNAATDGGQRTCSDANPIGECFGVQTCHTSDGWGDCSATEPALESCDGKDNDCNGLIDEELEGVGDACENTVDGVGSCAGVLACNGPNGLVCVGPVPEPEVCDFKDNNCDGAVDEAFKDDAGHWTLDAHCGGCFNDCAVKVEGGTGVCAGSPDAPLCVVDECDEGFVELNDYQCGLQPNVSCVPCSVDGDCYGGSCVDIDGQDVCLIPCAGEGGECPVGFECGAVPGPDGAAEVERCLPVSASCACTEANAGQKRSCQLSNGIGTCFGTETCNPEAGWVGCNAAIPAGEICDGKDNDCNGLVDDGLGGAASCSNDVDGVGSCPGIEVCLGPQGWVCQGPQPELEVCDFSDNDCDGKVDEDFKDEDGLWTVTEHCGTCGNDCTDKFAAGTGVCGGSAAAPVCVVGTCDEGFVKINAFQCLLPPDVSCQPCASDASCFDGSCVELDGQSVCVTPCDDGACGDGFACQVIDGEDRCVPLSGSCSCGALTDGATRPCQTANELGVCVGHQTCAAATGWSDCSAVPASAEVCDGKDNDCNGQVDDAAAEVGTACQNTVEGVGACNGTWACGGQAGLVCQAAVPAVEACDFADNDCDGSTDEDFKDAAGKWTLDAHCGTCGNDCAGKIANGSGVCGGTPAAPICVVGQCDEGFVQLNDFQCAQPPDVTCKPCAGAGDCFGGSCIPLDGQSVCVAPCDEGGGCPSGFSCQAVADGQRCMPDSGSCACTEATAGQVRACQVSNEVGTCLGTETCVPAEGWTGCTAKPPAAEECDGIDNDCNGALDDALADQGQPCTNSIEGIGSCAGINICLGATGWKCQGPTPASEVCNFADDDCDGSTDEDFRDAAGKWTLDGHCGTCGNDCLAKFDHGTGECGGAAQSPICVVSSCDEGYVAPNAFQCVLPPDVSCQPCAQDAVCYGGTCLPVDGQSVCVMPCDGAGECGDGFVCQDVGGVERCVPTTGSCSCDEGSAGAVRSCQVANDLGSCFGSQTCNAVSGWSACNAVPAAPETCDGKDNDCNGLVDDGIEEGGVCFNEVEGVGACEGVLVCTAGWICQGQQPSTEVCNFKDDDCDGQADEDFKVAGAWVLDAHCGTCGNDCSGKIEHGVGACGGSAASPVCVVSVCDEGYVKVNDFQCAEPPDVSCQPCATDAECYEGTCEAVDGVQVCISPCEGAGDCQAGYACDSGKCQPITASCTCGASNHGAKRTCEKSNAAGSCFGVETCDAGAGWSGCTAPEPKVETCDGFDQDCDGFIDEEVVVGEVCTNDVAGVGSCPGVTVCFGSQGLKCSGPVPTVEACDFQDNDCDGAIDETFKTGDDYTAFQHCSTCNSSCALGFPNAASTECSTAGAQPQCVVTACQDGFVQINAFQCIPDVANICQPCAADANCLGADSACVPLNEGSFCAKGCATEADCPSGFVCDDVGAPTLQCVPATGSCSCDGSNTDLSVACALTYEPPDAGQPSYTCHGQQQCTAGGWSACQLPLDACDGIDNNCDGVIDEPYKNASGAYTNIEHCGGCGNSCLAVQVPHAAPACLVGGGAVPHCGYACNAGWQDVNGLSDDGCECFPQPGADLVGDGLDTNCDGIEGDASLAIFVAKNGSDTALGGKGAPVLTLGKALTLASSQGKRDIYVATGVYSENVKLVSGVGLFGGYSADFGKRDTTVYETAIIGQDPTADKPGAITALGLGGAGDAKSTLIDGFTVFGANVANNAGANSYAMYIRDCGPKLEIRHNRVFGGAGGNGGAGGAGADGPDGLGGTAGSPAYDVGKISGGNRQCSNGADALDGGVGGTNSCPDGAVLNGGTGGDALCPVYGSNPSGAEAGTVGLGGSPGQGGVAGWDANINTANTSNCTLCVSPPGGSPHSAGFGGQGAAGVSGDFGDGCETANGVVDTGHWVGGAGSGGSNGSHGSGGGGGGAGGGVEVSGTNCYSASGGGGNTGNCCSTSNNTGCSVPSIQSCVCALDSFCCTNSWDSICVGEVTSFGCATCGSGGAPGPNIAGDDIGGSGGGGGAGGCRGLGGGGGSPGGGSFGIFVTFATTPTAVPVIEDNTIRAGTGGAGGAGGPGGTGGVGGAGAPGGPEDEGDGLLWCAEAGGTGGDGGQGGHGGGGGGGCGGASFGVFAWPPQAGQFGGWATSNGFLAGGSGGLGGPGGPSLGQAGLAGDPGATSSANF